ncbi:MAG: efflux RND transporter permease subunit, partial [Acetobacter peroxydans]|nr:efflux RND transporter permease subunit [Acetobacter peroxydans]
MAFFRWFIEKRVFLFCVVGLLMVAGLADLWSLPVEPVPDISPTQVLVTVQAPGLATEEVEKLVTAPIEKVMSGVVGLSGMRSVSRTGVAVLYLQFDEGTDIYRDREMVVQRLPLARDSVSVPGLSIDLGPLATGMGEILHLQIKGK